MSQHQGALPSSPEGAYRKDSSSQHPGGMENSTDPAWAGKRDFYHLLLFEEWEIAPSL